MDTHLAPIASPTGCTCVDCGFAWNEPTDMCPCCQATQVSRANKASSFTLLAIFVGLLSNSAILYPMGLFFLEARNLPAGTSIRPMGMAFSFFVTSFCGLVAGGPLCALGEIQQKRTNPGGKMKLEEKALVLNLAPLPVALILLRLITAFYGLELAE